MDIKVERILVPIDFSAPSKLALEYANALADRFGAEIKLVHVVERSPHEVYEKWGVLPGPAFTPTADISVDPGKRLVVRDLMEESRTRLLDLTRTDTGRKYQVDVRHGHAVEELLDEIAAYKPRVVVMGTHGWKGFRHMMLGSTTERMVRLSPVPVLTIRAQE